MKVQLDSDSPVPLFHQIAEAMRYHLATGRLGPGQSLPTLREAASSWGVNLHTVRRAYAELAAQGLVESRGARGTRVLESAPIQQPGDAVQDFVSRIVQEAQETHHLTAAELSHLIANVNATAPAADVVYVLECSESQCQGHAREIESRWNVLARTFCLTGSGEPPPGPAVATFFHYNEIRRRWPGRLHKIRFSAIHPSPELPARIWPTARGRRTTVQVIEFEEAMALNIAADLSLLLPADDFRIEPRVVTSAKELIDDSSGRTPLLLAPRVWDTLTADQRDLRHVHAVHYVFPEDELAEMGRVFGWRARPRRRSAPEPRRPTASPSSRS